MVNKIEYKELLCRLVNVMSVSGFEKDAAPKIVEILGELGFDSVMSDRVGNIIVKKCATRTAPAFVLDAHLDEIGFRVKEIRDDGTVTAVKVGGIDNTILPAAKVTIHGKSDVVGVFNSPSLKEGKVDFGEMYIDTGYPVREIRELIAVGDGISFRAPITEMAGGFLMGHAFDDKALAAAILCALAETPAEELAFDVYAVISSREEVGGGGAAYAALQANAVGALVTDVNFATAPGVSPDESGKLGGGPMLSLSAVTDEYMTRFISRTAEENGIPLSRVVEAVNTGTNASHVYVAGRGIPCAVLSLPEAGMHTASECISLNDAEELIRLMKLIISSSSLAEALAEREASFDV